MREARKLLVQRQELLAGLAGTPYSPGALPADASLGTASSKKKGKEKAEAGDSSTAGELEGAADAGAALVCSAAR